MIVDKLETLALYRSRIPYAGEIAAYLASLDLSSLNVGEYLVPLAPGSEMRVQRYLTESADALRWETHQKYLDIQIVLSGIETIGWLPAQTLRSADPYDARDDVTLYRDHAAGAALKMTPGFFVAFLPSDAHMPRICDPQPAPVHKIVVKVPV